MLDRAVDTACNPCHAGNGWCELRLRRRHHNQNIRGHPRRWSLAMLFPLYFLTCMVGNPTHCEMRVQHFADVSTPQQCLMIAQPAMAEWAVQHDRWRVAKLRCGKPPRDDGMRI